MKTLFSALADFVESPLVLGVIGIVVTALALILPPTSGSAALLLVALAILLFAAYRRKWFDAPTLHDTIARVVTVTLAFVVALGALEAGAWKLHKWAEAPQTTQARRAQPESPQESTPAKNEPAPTPDKASQKSAPQETNRNEVHAEGEHKGHNGRNSPPQEIIRAPNGIAIGGNAKVENPTVNNYGDVKVTRILTKAQIEAFVTQASVIPAYAQVGATANDREAYNLAVQIEDALVRAGWKVDPLSIFSSLGPGLSGIEVQYHGAAPTGPTVEISAGTPQVNFARALLGAHLSYIVSPYTEIPEGELHVNVYPAPPTSTPQ